jgi:hypothetical protein
MAKQTPIAREVFTRTVAHTMRLLQKSGTNNASMARGPNLNIRIIPNKNSLRIATKFKSECTCD